MKNLFAFAAVALVCAACTNPAALSEDDEVTIEKQRVTFKFSPYTVTSMGAKAKPTLPRRPVRRCLSVMLQPDHLDVWLMEGDSTTALAKHESVAENHQTVADDGFGSLSLTLDKSKTYTLYAVGHKESAPTTLSTGVVSFPDRSRRRSIILRHSRPPKQRSSTARCFVPLVCSRLSSRTRYPLRLKMEITAGETPTAAVELPSAHAGITPRRTPIPYRGRASSTRMTAPRCSAFIS